MNNLGLFITVEGVEGVGKTTNIEFIKEWLQAKGVEVCFTREPGGTPLAEEIRGLLLATRSEAVTPLAELLLVFAARAQHLNTKIETALVDGQWVLCDRFTDATYAYQGYGRGLPIDAIELLETLVQNGRQPDATFYLDLDVEVGLERARKRGPMDRFEQEDKTFFNNVRAGYLTRIKKDPDRYILVDAGKSLAEVQAQIVLELEALWAACQG